MDALTVCTRRNARDVLVYAMRTVLLWWALAFVGIQARAQTFNPVSDSLAIIITVKNFDTDTVEVFVVYGGQSKSFGYLPPHTERTLNLTSASLGTLPGVGVVFTQNGAVITSEKPLLIRRGTMWVLGVGTPPRKENA